MVTNMNVTDELQCPNCGTAATYQLGPNSFACKCTYEFETGEQK